jgi:hypothetical protein
MRFSSSFPLRQYRGCAGEQAERREKRRFSNSVDEERTGGVKRERTRCANLSVSVGASTERFFPNDQKSSITIKFVPLFAQLEETSTYLQYVLSLILAIEFPTAGADET